MNAIVFFTVVGLMINFLVDFVRNAFDKYDRVPKAWWQAVAWGIAVGISYAICNVPVLFVFFKVNPGPGCNDALLSALGFGSVAALIHSIRQRLGHGPSSNSPKGLLPPSGPVSH